MLAAKFWADERREVAVPGKRRPVVLRRSGWSDDSQEQAEANARFRLDAAIIELLAGEPIQRREPRLAYNGADGVPIREEVIATYAPEIITRNAYGAWCLNTPRVLFADVDRGRRIPVPELLALVLVASFTGYFAGLAGMSAGLAAAALGVALAAVYAHRRREAPERALAKAVDTWLQAHPSWRIREYETPAGWRLVATHRAFSVEDPEVLEFFRAIFADGTYVRMCRNQRCFRARLTPKPWRIGVTRLRGPVWPVRDPEAMERRKAWVDAYEARSASFAACRFLREAGVGLEDTEVRRVVDLHDTLSRALSGLPIA